MSKPLFRLIPVKREEEPKTPDNDPLTALTLSTGAPPKKPAQPTIGNRRENLSEFQGTPVGVKRQRELDGTALTIGAGTGSNFSCHVGTNEVPNRQIPCTICAHMYANLVSAHRGFYGGDWSVANPVNEVYFRGGEIGFANQLQRGFITQNLGLRKAGETGGADSEPEVMSADHSKMQIPFLQKAENGFGMTATVVIEKKVGTTTFRTEKVRHRLIKNRESAAKSRAKKQAFEAQQHSENEDLKKQNDDLKKVVRMLMVMLKAKKLELPTLRRTFSATF